MRQLRAHQGRDTEVNYISNYAMRIRSKSRNCGANFMVRRETMKRTSAGEYFGDPQDGLSGTGDSECVQDNSEPRGKAWHRGPAPGSKA